MDIKLHQIDAAQLSTPPTNPEDWQMYLDDGTNTASGVPGWRQWNPLLSAWVDLGLQSVEAALIDGGSF